MNKKIIALSLVLLMIVFTVSCSNATKNVSIRVEIDNEILPEADFMCQADLVVDERANAAACFADFFNKCGIESDGLSEGFITSIDKYALDGNYSWMFYINGELAEVGVDDYIPSDRDSITLVYTDWSKLF